MPDRDPVARRTLDWPPLPSVPDPAPGTCHVVAALAPRTDYDDTADRDLLSAPERARADRFRFAVHRDRWTFGRALLKRLLARYAGCAPDAVRLGFGEIGKPYLAAPPHAGIRFNYTDSGGHLLYAIGIDRELGIDLEHLPRPTNHAALAARKLSSREYAAFETLDERHRELAFLANWTRKEAYGKALGVGIRYPMETVTLCEDYASADYGADSEAAGAVWLTQLEPPFPGIACLAVVGGPVGIRGFTCDASVFNA